MNYRLSPSDLTFTYNGCKRCFYLKVVKSIPQPSIPLPSMFTKIAGLLKNHYIGKQTSELHLDLPPGIIAYGEKKIRSKIIKLPKHQNTCYISGRFDIVINFQDGTYGVIDFKTAEPHQRSIDLYSYQLHAYAYALEHAASGSLNLYPVSKIGLLYISPSRIDQQDMGNVFYGSDVTWVEIEKDESTFMNFINKVMDVLDSPIIPDHSPNCQWCTYSRRAAELWGK